MSIEEIINQLEIINNWYCPRESKGANAVASAIALLKTHPEAKPNEPLPLEELRGMEGCPVWTVTKGISDPGRWELVIYAECEDRLKMASGEDEVYEIYADSYGKTWLAYRRPLKED